MVTKQDDDYAAAQIQRLNEALLNKHLTPLARAGLLSSLRYWHETRQAYKKQPACDCGSCE